MVRDAAIAAAQAHPRVGELGRDGCCPAERLEPGAVLGGALRQEACGARRHRREVEVIGRRAHGATDDLTARFDGGQEDRLVKRMIGAGQ